MSALHEARRTLRGRAAVATAVMLAALWAADDVAQGAEGSCTVNQATFRTEENSASTDSATFVNVPQATLDITVGGPEPTCVIVVFAAQTQTTVTENMAIRARIPGIGNGEPAQVFFGPGTGAVETRSAQFIFENVPPGNYSVRMQYRSAVEGDTVTISRPTVVVHHR